jgi:DNA-binding HxlR family transcriptional regulator
MRQTSFSEMHCSLARSLEVVGDWWSPLVIRDIYLGVDTFDDIARDLGISRGLLSARLTTLIDGGILSRELYVERPERYRYRLTDAGRDLVPVLVALTAWGDRWRSPEGPPVVFSHHDHLLDPVVSCAACGDRVLLDDLEARPGPGGRLAPGTVVVAERLMARA